MKDRIKEAYDAVKAGEALRCAAKNAALQALASHCDRKTPYMRRFVTAAAAMALVAVITGACAVYTAPVMTVLVETEPAVELQVNRFNRVVATKTEAGEPVSVARFTTYTDAVQTLIRDEEEVHLTVFCENGERREETLACLREDVGENGRIPCEAGDAKMKKAAQDCGLPYGKYVAFCRWKELDPSVTPDDARKLSVREIRERIAVLTENENTVATESENGPCGAPTQIGQHNGQGNQYGKDNQHSKGNPKEKGPKKDPP